MDSLYGYILWIVYLDIYHGYREFIWIYNRQFIGIYIMDKLWGYSWIIYGDISWIICVDI